MTFPMDYLTGERFRISGFSCSTRMPLTFDTRKTCRTGTRPTEIHSWTVWRRTAHCLANPPMILVTRVRDLIQAIDACIALSYQTQKCTLFRGRNMSDVIATVWDFGKTLIPGYMQDPIFKHYGVEAAAFWKENSDEIEALQKKEARCQQRRLLP